MGERVDGAGLIVLTPGGVPDVQLGLEDFEIEEPAHEICSLHN